MIGHVVIETFFLCLITFMQRVDFIIQDPASCSLRWYQFQNKRYFLEHESKKNYENALLDCKSKNATLAIIHSREELEFLASKIISSYQIV